MSDGDWIAQAEAAATAGRSGVEGVRVLRGHRPPVLAGEGVKAVVTPLFVGLFAAAAAFRELLAGSSMDPIAMGLRLLAVGFATRMLVLGWRFVRRIRVWRESPGYCLVLHPEGMFYRRPGVDLVIPRGDVQGVVERGAWQSRAAGRRWNDVYVVTDPAGGRCYVAFPPVFAGTPGQLAERLMRWRGAPPPAGHAPPEQPAPMASRLWDAAAEGHVPSGTTAIRHGWAWLTRAPYLAAWGAVVVVEGLARGGPQVLDAIEPAVGGGLLVVLAIVPARWLWQQRRDVSPGKGLSLVLTPAELLIRTANGILRTPWSQLASVRVDARRWWSLVEGVHEARQLVITRSNAPAIRYDEPYLGTPAEVARILCEAYARGALPAGAPTDSATDEEE